MKSTLALAIFLVFAGCAEEPQRAATPPSLASSNPAPTSSLRIGSTPPTAPATPEPKQLEFRGVPLPGATAPASLDYIAFEPERSRVWVPVGGTGSVDVYDTATGSFTRVDGFKTAQRESRGTTRITGPSAVAIGDGTAYIGNRASSEVCPVDSATLKLGACLTLASPTDGVAYVSATKEVWVTTPRDQSIVVLDASRPSALKVKTTIGLEGAPEGYAVDRKRGLFFTNLEDKNKTVTIDIQKHVPTTTWNLECDASGPRGIAVDARGLVYVACTDHVVVLDGLHDGVKRGAVDTGSGVDNIDLLEAQHLLYVAAAKARRLTVAQIEDDGSTRVVAEGASVDGARNGVVDALGNVYVADPLNARLLIFKNSK
jgi:DNA-binding beta-propeller fold protein YncE